MAGGGGGGGAGEELGIKLLLLAPCKAILAAIFSLTGKSQRAIFTFAT